ncbi:hypothetical protein BCR44DRAFT_1433809 [Catenaria anguillulae PL171]|uniref:Uncharacterized protein n=1 Tax=Catenaria anguillulae PL171 TaxID=765915 RepID=A0A1Y2HLU9_9FUNG|nr:hypothetical protein BCR44DRAFT_1433809 [Catenaria anguillulae PL171]
MPGGCPLKLPQMSSLILPTYLCFVSFAKQRLYPTFLLLLLFAPFNPPCLGWRFRGPPLVFSYLTAAKLTATLARVILFCLSLLFHACCLLRFCPLIPPAYLSFIPTFAHRCPGTPKVACTFSAMF